MALTFDGAYSDLAISAACACASASSCFFSSSASIYCCNTFSWANEESLDVASEDLASAKLCACYSAKACWASYSAAAEAAWSPSAPPPCPFCAISCAIKSGLMSLTSTFYPLAADCSITFSSTAAISPCEGTSWFYCCFWGKGCDFGAGFYGFATGSGIGAGGYSTLASD